jgi:hypothetical protein
MDDYTVPVYQSRCCRAYYFKAIHNLLELSLLTLAFSDKEISDSIAVVWR